jgi:hypothetical protein
LTPVGPVPVPVVVVDVPPGAAKMPADPGFVVVEPAVDEPCAPVATPAFYGNAEDVTETRAIATAAERCNLCRMRDIRFESRDVNAPGIPSFPEAGITSAVRKLRIGPC